MENKNTRIGVYGLLIEDEKLLMIKKSRGPYKGKYDLPGGKIEEGESPEKALVREFKEETGLDIEIGDFLAVSESDEFYKNDKGEDRRIYLIGSYYFVSKKSGVLKISPDGEDSLGAEFILLNEINKKNISTLSFKIIEEYGKIRKN